MSQLRHHATELNKLLFWFFPAVLTQHWDRTAALQIYQDLAAIDSWR